MSVLRVKESGLFLFTEPSPHADSSRDLLSEGAILLSFDFVPEGTQLRGDRWPADYDWYLVRTSNWRVGWVAGGSKMKEHRSYLERLE